MLPHPRLTAALAAAAVSATALAALRTSAPTRFPSVERIVAAIGVDVAFATAPDGCPEIALAPPPESDPVGRAAAAIVAAPRVVTRADGRYALRVAALPDPANELLAPGRRLAEAALADLNRRTAARAREFAARFATLEG